MLTLDSLEPELVQIIVEYVNNSSPRTTKSIALVNKYLYSATRVVASRYKTITYERREADHLQQLIDSLFSDDNAFTSVQHLTVRNHYRIKYGEETSIIEDNGYFQPVAELLGKVGKLRSLTWSTRDPLSQVVLDTLHIRQPAAKLKIFDFKRLDPAIDHLTTTEATLARSLALTHLRMQCDVAWHIPGGRDYRLAAFKAIVARAPNLEYAGIISDDFNLENERSEENLEGLPKLAPLNTKANASIRALTLDGANLELSPNTLDHWKDIVDLSQINNLKFSRGIPTAEYFKLAPQMLPNLKHVSLNFGAVFGGPENSLLKAARSYLYNCPALHTISLWSWTKVIEIEDLLRQHGAQLESLQLHEKNTFPHHDRDKRKILTPDEIQMVRRSCPQLYDLTMDLNREDKDFDLDSETDILPYITELSLFGSRLQKLQLYIDKYSHHGLPQLGSVSDDENEGEEDDEDSEENESDEDDNEEEDDNNDDDQNGVNGEANVVTPVADNETSAQEAQPPEPSTTNPLDDPPNTNPTTEASTAAIESTAFIVNNTVNRESPSSPPAKRPRMNETAPCRPPIESYVKQIWKSIFGDKTTGARALDIKFGEWESRDMAHERKLFFEVRPHERDDRLGQCWVKMQERNSRSR